MQTICAKFCSTNEEMNL